MPDALRTPFAEETGTHLLAMLRAAARARLGHDAPAALAEIAGHARELRGAAATVGLEPVAAVRARHRARRAGRRRRRRHRRCSPTRVAALHDGLAAHPARPGAAGRAPLAVGRRARRCGRRRPQAPTVLLVDDSPVTLRVHADLLRRAGFEVRGARDGADALDDAPRRPRRRHRQRRRHGADGRPGAAARRPRRPGHGRACPSSSSAHARPTRSPRRATACASTPSSPRAPPSSSCRARSTPRWPAATGSPPPACSWPTTRDSCAR